MLENMGVTLFFGQNHYFHKNKVGLNLSHCLTSCNKNKKKNENGSCAGLKNGHAALFWRA